MEPKNLQAWAQWLHRLVWAFILLAMLAYLAARLGVEGGTYLRVENRTGGGGWMTKLPADLAMGMFFAALINLASVVRRIAAGELFGPPVTRALRRFAFWLFLSSATTIVGPPLAQLAVATSEAAHRVRIEADLRDLFFLVASLVFYLVAAVIDRAATIDAELREIV